MAHNMAGLISPANTETHRAITRFSADKLNPSVKSHRAQDIEYVLYNTSLAASLARGRPPTSTAICPCLNDYIACCQIDYASCINLRASEQTHASM